MHGKVVGCDTYKVPPKDTPLASCTFRHTTKHDARINKDCTPADHSLTGALLHAPAQTVLEVKIVQGTSPNVVIPKKRVCYLSQICWTELSCLR